MTVKAQRKSAGKAPVEPSNALPVADKNARGSVEDMQGETLQAYARKVGIIERDIQGLTEDRLRQNIRAAIHAAMEDE
jgi:hypothetical protein